MLKTARELNKAIILADPLIRSGYFQSVGGTQGN